MVPPGRREDEVTPMVGMVEVELGNIGGQGDGTDLGEPGVVSQKNLASLLTPRMVCNISAGLAVLAVLIFVFINSAQVSQKPDDERIAFHSGAQSIVRKNMRFGAVSATHHLAAEAGMAALEAGGNAADAAAAIQFALNVVQPFSTGIGGGFLALIYNATTGVIHTIDAREEAPRAFHQDIFCKDRACWDGPCNCTEGYMSTYEAHLGGISVGIPGTPAGVDKLIKDHGKRTLADALQPAITLAKEGFPMYELWEKVVKEKFLDNPEVLSFPALKEGITMLLDDSRRTPRYALKQTITNHALAQTFELLAEKGVSEFYNGQLAQEIVKAVQDASVGLTERRGVMTLADMQGYRAVGRHPIRSSYRGKTVFGMGPPTSGGVAIAQMLNLLEGYDMKEFKHNGLDHIAHMLQASNLAFADRDMYLGDGDFVGIPLGWLSDEECAAYATQTCPAECRPSALGGCEAKGLLSKSYARARRGQFMNEPMPSPPLPAGVFPGQMFAASPPQDEKGTSHLVTADSEGNVVSMTTTIERNFGSGVLVPGRGFFLNNEMTDFSLKPHMEGRLVANAPSGERRPRRTALGDDASTLGGKRPRSSMAPTIVLGEDGKPLLAIGSPGGAYIIQNVLGGIVSMLDMDLTLGAAINATRAWSFNDGKIRLEGETACKCNGGSFLSNSYVRAGLVARGLGDVSEASPSTRPFLQGIWWNALKGTVDAGADVQRATKAGAYVK